MKFFILPSLLLIFLAGIMSVLAPNELWAMELVAVGLVFGFLSTEKRDMFWLSLVLSFVWGILCFLAFPLSTVATTAMLVFMVSLWAREVKAP